MSRATSGRGSYGIVKAKYVHNRSQKTGRHVTGDVSRLAHYNVYGNRKNNQLMQERGPIYNEQGERVKYGEYKAWAIGRTVDHKYTYRLIISPKGHTLKDDDFIASINNAAAATGIGDSFHVVIHRDTKNAHGHVLFHTNKTLNKKELEAWKRSMREKMIELEAKREEDQLKRTGMGKSSGAASSEKVEKPKQKRRRRRRSKSKSRDEGIEL